MSSRRRAAVLGRPIGHSLSPALHRAAYAALRLRWSYTAIDCGVGELAGLLETRADWAGFSCTMPLKHAALEVAAEVRASARAVGAANTLLPRPGGGWIADNTDVAGVLGALAEHELRPSSVTVLGAGGTAQAVLAALSELGIGSCVVLVRAPARTARLRSSAEALGLQVEVDRLRADASALGAELVVSTLPRGAADGCATAPWSRRQTVLDAAYDPWPTALGAAAAAAGATVISGAVLLLHQAAAQVELMTGRPAPLPAMRAALHDALPAAGR